VGRLKPAPTYGTKPSPTDAYVGAGFSRPHDLAIRIIGSYRRVALHAGQRLGLESFSSLNTNSHCLQRAGITSTW
jgi:hypothetical protein